MKLELWRCDRCGKESKDLSGWYEIRVYGDNIFGQEANICSDKCLKQWMASTDRPWNNP